MKLSIVIVNYNVKYFLRQTLLSVFNSRTDFPYDVYVVDNASEDGSVQMLQKEFPRVIILANTDNKGFSKANNQAIRISKGEYVLLLNPDTVIEEDTLHKIVAYMDTDATAGALGVYMIDGKGEYLPESKRGFPSPEAAFYKLFGFSKLFPKNKKFGKYHLTYLNRNNIHTVDVLSGAFMLLRRAVIDEVGLLDEDYFMYGEDIDLSYRIKKAGFNNIYFPDTKIIHYKGESTKKGSLNYIKVFYEAMIIFANKHFGKGNASFMTLLLKMAIYVRAALAIIQSWTAKFLIVLLDIAIFFAGLLVSQTLMQHIFHSTENFSYPETLLYINYPIYILIWLLSIYYGGGYDRPYNILKSSLGILGGTLLIGFVYGFLPMSLRTSRGIILIATLWNLVFCGVLRYITRAKSKEYLKRQIAVVGTIHEYEYIKQYLADIHSPDTLIGCIAIVPDEEKALQSIGHIHKLTQIVQSYGVDEVIFCRHKLSSADIISYIQKLPTSVSSKIASEDLLHIIGSKSKNTRGEIFTFDFNFNIKKPYYLRLKRLQDILISLIFIAILPLLLIYVDRRINFIKNILDVIMGKKYWVGFQVELPFAYPHIIGVLCPIDKDYLTEKQQEQLLLEYAKEYTPYDDLRIILFHLKYLGN